MFPDRDVWQAALLIVKRYGDDAMLEAAERADQLLDECDMAGAETWRRILDASGCRRKRRRRVRGCTRHGRAARLKQLESFGALLSCILRRIHSRLGTPLGRRSHAVPSDG
jgi:hypothetical protein